MRHYVLAASGVSWAKAAMKAETTRRPLLPAWASTFLMKWTRHLCHVAHSILVTAALMVSVTIPISRLSLLDRGRGVRCGPL